MMTIEQLYQIYLQFPTVCTDTRKISQGCLFFALKGDNFDGNTFAEKALAAGAAYAVMDNPAYHVSEKCILVEDVLQALQQLASYHRDQLRIPFVGITGTNGKTTTKELLNSVLSQKFSTYATVGNLNNHIGVPLTLLAIGRDIELAIIEMGANHQKEIAFLSSIAKPTHGLITNVGKAHLEGFGGFEGVKIGKGELYDFLQSSNGTIFINSANPHLAAMCQSRHLKNTVAYVGNNSMVKGEIVENNPYLIVSWEYQQQKHIAKTNLTGAYNLENILAAITVGIHFGLSAEQVNKGITDYVPGNNRSQVTRTEKNTLICDYYNANPSSMTVALENFKNLNASNKVIILGDMFELGNESAGEHVNILQKAAEIDALKIFIGNEFSRNDGKFDALFFSTTSQAADFLQSRPISNASILIKGSRGMRLETLISLL